jgi:hypothetical protein
MQTRPLCWLTTHWLAQFPAQPEHLPEESTKKGSIVLKTNEAEEYDETLLRAMMIDLSIIFLSSGKLDVRSNCKHGQMRSCLYS